MALDLDGSQTQRARSDAMSADRAHRHLCWLDQ
jgi:hypothetical protein